MASLKAECLRHIRAYQTLAWNIVPIALPGSYFEVPVMRSSMPQEHSTVQSVAGYHLLSVKGHSCWDPHHE
jgi:hypothetical protein